MPVRSLADDLRARTDVDLARLLAGRPDLLHPVPPDITALAARAGSATSTARALDRLDALALAVALAISTQEEPCSPQQVIDTFDESVRDRAAHSLAHLRTMALAWGDEESVRLTRSARDALLRDPALAATWSAEPPITVDRGAERVERTAGQHALATIMGVTALAESWSGPTAPGVLRKGGLGVRDLTACARLLDADEGTAALWIETAHAAGLLARDGEVDERWRPTATYDDWHDSTLAQQWLVLARAWLSMPRSPSLVGAGANALSDDMLGRGEPLLRDQVLQALADLPAGHAPADPSEVSRRVDLMAPRQSGAARAARVEAIVRELEIMGFTGGGALADIARVAAGMNDHDAEATVIAAMPAPLDHILLQADLTAVAPGPLVSEIARELRLLADVESTGGAIVYRFTPETIRRALDAGRDSASTLEFLTSVSRTPVPQPLAYLIEDTARRHGIVRIGLATAYVRCDDEATLATFLADPRSVALGCTLVAPNVVAISGRPEDAAVILRSLGLHPVAEDSSGRVILPGAAALRAPAPPRSAPVVRRDATPELIAAAVSSLRAATRDHAKPTGPHLDPMSASDTVMALRRAIAESTAVWIAHGDEELLIEPLRLSAGTLTGVDRITGQVRNLAVARLAAAIVAE